MNKNFEKIHGFPIHQNSRHFTDKRSLEQLLRCEWEDRVAVNQFYVPPNLVAKDFVRQSPIERHKQEFACLIEEWVSAIKYKSLESQQINHPAFLRIIAIGEKVLPSVFEEFSKRPFMAWLKALSAIVGQDVASEAKSFPEAIKLWTEWGKESGYLPK
jgi:hypothetical protein